MYGPPTVKSSGYETMDYTVVDLETTIRNTGEDAIGTQQASPHHPNNKIHLYGSTVPQPITSLAGDSFFIIGNRRKKLSGDMLSVDMFTSDLMVGQNLKFDLLYLLVHHKPQLLAFLRKGGVIWDTMQVEYLLSNQQDQFAPLGNKYKETPRTDTGGTLRTQTRQGMAEKYGGTDKDDRIAEYWKEGVDTPDIPLEQLVAYLDSDLRNTSIVFREQYKASIIRGQEFQNLVQTQMQAIVATAFAEYNGMKFDIDRASEDAIVMAKEHDALEIRLSNYMADEFNLHIDMSIPNVLREDCNPGSVQQLSTMFFGGEFKYTNYHQMKTPTGELMVIKSGANKGNPKMKHHRYVAEVDPLHAVGHTCKEGLVKNTLGYVMDDAACQKVIDSIGATTTQGVFLKCVLKYRQLGKNLKTYYIGLMNLTWPTDGCIHGSMNHCSTGTGRLSSSAPNMQNVSGK